MPWNFQGEKKITGFSFVSLCAFVPSSVNQGESISQNCVKATCGTLCLVYKMFNLSRVFSYLLCSKHKKKRKEKKTNKQRWPLNKPLYRLLRIRGPHYQKPFFFFIEIPFILMAMQCMLVEGQWFSIALIRWLLCNNYYTIPVMATVISQSEHKPHFLESVS